MRIESFLVLPLSLFLATACVKGVGDPCRVHAECAAGLVCSAGGTCEPCGDEVSCLGIDLVVKTCDLAAPDVLAPPMNAVRVTIEGDGMLPVVQTAAVASHRLSLPQLPFGKNRRLTVEAFVDLNAAPVARGVSLPFDLSAEEPPASVTVFVRPIGKFSHANSAAEPTVCSRLSVPRAGHATTLMQDGRVLVSGGYAFDDAGKQVFLKAVEIYDPRTGDFTSLETGLHAARAGHTTHLLPDGRVLLVGGYALVNAGITALKTAEIFDPTSGRFDFLIMNHARMEHASVALPNGVVVVAGGVTEKGASPQNTIELFLPTAPPGKEFSLAQGVTLKTARAGHAGIAVSPDRVLFIGGFNDATPLSSVEGFSLLGTSLQAEEGGTLTLGDGRSQPSAFILDAGEGPGVVVVGAPASNTQTTAKAWDWLPLGEGAAPTRAEQPVPVSRFFGCTAPFAGGALLAGGVVQGAFPPETSRDFLASADVYRVTPAGGIDARPATNSLIAGRKLMACTTLADGSVLVTGGEAFEGGRSLAADVAEIFQP